MIFKRLTSIALIAALCLPSTLMAVKKNYYLKEADSEGRPLIPLTSSTAAAGETLREPSTSGTNTFVNVPLETSSSRAGAQTLGEIESQVGPSRKRPVCTPERLTYVVGCIWYSLAGLLILGVIAEIITLIYFSLPPSDPCAHQMTLPSATEIGGTIGSKRSAHNYQKRRGGGNGRGGVSRICPSTTSRSATPMPTTLLSNFFDLTSGGERISTEISSTTSDNTPPPLVQE